MSISIAMGCAVAGCIPARRQIITNLTAWSHISRFVQQHRSLIIPAISDACCSMIFVLLQATVAHFEQRLQQSEVLRTEAISDATAALEDDVTRLIDERDDLLQRVRFFERQVAKLQAGMSDHDVSIEHQSTQTEDVEFTTADEQVLHVCIALCSDILSYVGNFDFEGIQTIQYPGNLSAE